MSGILYLLALLVVPWLIAWTVIDPSRPSKIWWPFDMKGGPTAPQRPRWQARPRPDAARRPNAGTAPTPPSRARR